MAGRPAPRARRSLGARATIGLAAVLALWLLGSAGCAIPKLQTARELAARSEPLQQTPADPTERLLVVGDSTAAGTGASAAPQSVPGLIARDHPRWTIVNRAADGATFADIVDQLQAADGRFDRVLVMGGGNDVIRLTGRDTLQRHVQQAVERALALAPSVVLLPPGNVGNAPFFFPPWSWWMSARARMLHDVVRGVAARHEPVHYVNLYQPAETDPFAQQPDRLHAADGLHPSDDGYALWYRELQQQSPF